MFGRSEFDSVLPHAGLDRCQQPLFNAAFLGITNPPQSPSPENITIGYVKKALDTIAPRMEQLKKAVKDGYPEDMGKRMEEEVENMTKSYSAKIDKLVEGKEKDIMTI